MHGQPHHAEDDAPTIHNPPHTSIQPTQQQFVVLFTHSNNNNSRSDLFAFLSIFLFSPSGLGALFIIVLFQPLCSTTNPWALGNTSSWLRMQQQQQQRVGARL